MTKIDHERGVLRLRDSGAHEPHWSGFERGKTEKRKKAPPDPEVMAKKFRYMELCAISLECGHNFPRIPRCLAKAIVVNKKMDKARLISAWLGRQEEFEQIQIRVRVSRSAMLRR
ncbi:hypothetical protein ACS4RR_023725 [Rhizobium sp. Z1P35]